MGDPVPSTKSLEGRGGEDETPQGEDLWLLRENSHEKRGGKKKRWGESIEEKRSR